jgi:hypothetical protein
VSAATPLIVTLVGAGAGAVVRGGVVRGGVVGVPVRDVGGREGVAGVAAAVGVRAAPPVTADAEDGGCAVVAVPRDGGRCAVRRGAGDGVGAVEPAPVSTIPAGTTPAAARGAGCRAWPPYRALASPTTSVMADITAVTARRMRGGLALALVVTM